MPLKDTGLSKDQQADLRKKHRPAKKSVTPASPVESRISIDEQADLRRKLARAPKKPASAPVKPVKAEAAPAPVEYTIAPGDSLSKIAQKFYGSGANWQVLYEANKDTIGNNPAFIKPGQVLTIPKLP